MIAYFALSFLGGSDLKNMKKHIWKSVVAMLLLELSACTHDFSSVIEQEKELSVIVYHSGHEVETGVITKNSEAYKSIIKWIKDNRTGWQSTVATYVPELIVRGEGFQLNLRPKDAIFGYGNEQFVLAISDADYSNLVQKIQLEIKRKLPNSVVR